MALMTHARPIADLRELDPPEPLLRILGEIETVAHGRFVFLLSRNPALIYPLLTQAGWRHDLRHDERGFELTVFRDPGIP